MATTGSNVGNMITTPFRYLRAFWNWWTSEIVSTLPRSFVNFFHDKRRVLIRSSNDYISASVEDGQGNVIPIATRVDLSSAATTIQAALDERQYGIKTAILELAPDVVLNPIIEVPIEASANLQDVISAEIDRQTPFSPDEVYYAFRILEADENLESIRVQLHITPKRVVDAVRSLADRVRLSLLSVRPSDADPDSAINLLPREFVRKQTTPYSRLSFAMLLCILALSGVVSYLTFDRLQRTHEIADSLIAEQRATYARLSDTAQARDQQRDLVQRLTNRKTKETSAIGLLSDITKLIPDDSWLAHMQMSGDRIVLSGFTKNSSSLIKALESSNIFTDVRFSAPVTRDQNPELERFNITLTVQRGKSV